MGGCPIRPEIVLCEKKHLLKETEILITRDTDKRKLVVIPHVLFKGKRSISWKEVYKKKIYSVFT